MTDKLVTESWVETIHNLSAGIDNEACELRRIAQALEVVGNTVLGEQLRSMSTILLTCTKGITSTIGEYLHEQVQEGQKSITETLQVLWH